MSTTIHRRLLPALLASLLLIALVPGAASAASRPTRFELYLNSSCVGGYSNDGALVELTWRRASGKLMVHETFRAGNNGGYWEACAGDGFTTPRLKLGDRLQAKVGSAVRKLTVPTLTLRFNRANDVFKGRAPASTSVRLGFAGGLYSDVQIERTVAVKSDGTWKYREPDFDIMGGQYAYLRWKNAKNDRLTLDGVAPYIRLTLGASRFTGGHYAGTSFEARLRDPSSGELRAIGPASANIDGAVSGRFRDSNGHTVPVSAGLRLKALKLAGDANWIVPNVTGSASAGTDEVKGRCFDGGISARWYDVRVVAPDGDTRARAAGSTGSAGSFAVDFGVGSDGLFYTPGDVRPGDLVVIGCLQRTGDWTQRELIAP